MAFFGCSASFVEMMTEVVVAVEQNSAVIPASLGDYLGSASVEYGSCAGVGPNRAGTHTEHSSYQSAFVERAADSRLVCSSA